METIITEIVGKLKREIEEFSKEKGHSIDEAERYFVPRIKEAVTAFLSSYYEEMDRELREDKAGRKAEGLRVVRCQDQREVLTQLGTVRYRRTYYRKASGDYEYPVDKVAGLAAYQRISDSVGTALVENAAVMTYANASALVTDGYVSRQTVMNKIRQSRAVKPPVLVRNVPVLHIDADEDHVALQTGKSTIVPLISSYEGTVKHGKRGECVNVFHVSEYGKSAETLWEQFSDELDRRYDLTNTRIYLHGDGASWIKKGLEYLPNSTFVLDRYHVNSAKKQALAGYDGQTKTQYLQALHEAEVSGDRDLYESLVESICAQGGSGNADAARYLLNNFEAIHIHHADPEASRGGATEPHVSHVLSSRLSSRPMGWSKTTLKHLVPILAAGAATLRPPIDHDEPFISQFKHYLKPKKKSFLPNSLGLPDPDSAVFPRTRTGHRPYALNLLT